MTVRKLKSDWYHKNWSKLFFSILTFTFFAYIQFLHAQTDAPCMAM